MKTPKTVQRLTNRVRSSLLEWLGVPIELTDGDFWKEFYGGGNSADVLVNDRTMMKLSAVWACARLISETISTLPLGMYERTPSGRRPAPQHPLQIILHDMPNQDTTATMHWEATVAAMLLRGNGRAEKLMLGDRVVGLQFLTPGRLDVGRDSRGERTYRYRDLDGTAREIPRSRVFNIPGFSTDGVEGLSVVRYGAEVFSSALAAGQAAGRTFANGLFSNHYFQVDRVLNPQQRKDFHADTKARIMGQMHAGSGPLLEAGFKLGTIGMNPDDAQLLESRGFGVEEVCRWFRVPPFMVGHGEKQTSWGTGIEQMMIGFLTFVIAPWLKRIEQAIAKDLMTPADRVRFYPKFAIEGLLRGDSAARAAFYSTMVNNGIFTRDQCRALEEQSPMGGNAAVLTVQSAMVPLDSIGQAGAANDAQQARAALQNWLGLLENHPILDEA